MTLVHAVTLGGLLLTNAMILGLGYLLGYNNRASKPTTPSTSASTPTINPNPMIYNGCPCSLCARRYAASRAACRANSSPPSRYTDPNPYVIWGI